jgi:hypothetical protein
MSKWLVVVLLVCIAGYGVHRLMFFAVRQANADYFFPQVRAVWLYLIEYEKDHGGSFPDSLTNADFLSRVDTRTRECLQKHHMVYYRPESNASPETTLLVQTTKYYLVVGNLGGGVFGTNEVRTTGGK